MNWKLLRKSVAVVAALALVVGLFPAYAVADSVGGDGGGTAVIDAANDKGDANGNDTASATEGKVPAVNEKAPAGKEQTPTADENAPAGKEQPSAVDEKAAAEGQPPTAEDKALGSKAPLAAKGNTRNAGGERAIDEPTPIDAATINVTVPEAGSSNVDAEAIVSVPDSAHYSIRSAYWVTGDASSVSIDRYSGTLEAGQNYALTIVLLAESGYMFHGADDTSGIANSTFAVVRDGALVNDGNQIRVDNTTGYVQKPDGTWAETVTESEGWTNVLITPASRDTVNMHIWTLGHGKVLVNGSDYGFEFEGTWYEGAEVEIEAVPDDGYKFGRWWIQKNPGPNAIVEDAVTTLVAGTDLAANVTFGLETAYVTITPPVAGDTAATAPQISVPSGAGYGLDTYPGYIGSNVEWVTADSLYNREPLDSSTVFEAGQTYYAYVRLADGEDSFAATAGGSSFNTNLEVTGGTKTAQGNFAATSTDSDQYMGIEAIIAVTIPEANTHTVTFDTDGHYSPAPQNQEVADGEKATRPANPARDEHASDYSTTGLSFRGWYTKPANEISSYWEFCYTKSTNEAGCIFDFNEPITQNTTAYAVYEGVLTIKAYDVTNSVEQAGGTFDHSNYNYYSSPSSVSSVQTFAFYNMPEFLKAKPNEGYKFVGWSTSTSKDDVISEEAEYEYIFKQRETLYALFEADTVTVTFDAKEGVPAPEQQTFATGGKATRPSVEPRKDGWGLRGWYTDDTTYSDETKFDFETSVTENMTLYAGWAKSMVIMPYDLTSDEPGGGGIAANGSEPGGGIIVLTVFEGTENTLSATPNDGYEFVGWSTTTSEDDIISGAGIQYSFEADDDTPGQLVALFREKPITVTIHASTREGELDEDYAPIVCTSVPKGLTYSQAMAYIQQTEGSNHINLNTTGKYPLYAAWNTKQPFSTYASGDAALNDRFSGNEVLNEDTDVYIPYKMLAPVEITVTAPVCGQSAASDTPQVTTPEGAKWNAGSPDGFSRWVKGASDPGTYTGGIVGGNDYYIYVIVNLQFGYYSNDNSTVTVNGGEFVTNWMTGGTSYGFFAKVTAVHDPADAVEENVAAPKCTEAGSHDEVVYCNACRGEISRETIEDAALGHDWDEGKVTTEPTCTDLGVKTFTCSRCDETKTEDVDALGHDWGEWKVVKEATDAADGLEQRTCARCGEFEDRVIPKIGIEYRCVAGDGGSLVFGSGETLSFVFKRNINDETSFSHFTGIMIDGKVVDKSNYTAKSGSVIVTLEPSFTKTLSVGGHTIEAMFDDGDNASASFTVTAVASEDETTPAKGKPADKAASKSATPPKTGDALPIGAVVLTAIAAAAALAFAWRKRRA